jgi:hypothetical protein
MWTSERLSGSRGGSRMSEPVRLKEEPTETRSIMSGMVVVARLLPGPSASREMSTSGVRPLPSVLFERLRQEEKHFKFVISSQLRGIPKQKIMIIIKPNFIHVKVIFLDGQFMYDCFKLVELKYECWNW